MRGGGHGRVIQKVEHHCTRLHISSRVSLNSKKIDSGSSNAFYTHTHIRYIRYDSFMTCSICFDDFNASTRKPIRCPIDSCAKCACRSCYQTFLCGDDVSVPKCMFCNTQFTHSQLLHIGLTKSFIQGEFAKHQQDILFAQEI